MRASGTYVTDTVTARGANTHSVPECSRPFPPAPPLSAELRVRITGVALPERWAAGTGGPGQRSAPPASRCPEGTCSGQGDLTVSRTMDHGFRGGGPNSGQGAGDTRSGPLEDGSAEAPLAPYLLSLTGERVFPAAAGVGPSARAVSGKCTRSPSPLTMWGRVLHTLADKRQS